MGLKSGAGGQKSRNFFVNLVEVIDIVDNSKDSKADVSIKVTVQQEGYDYPNTMFISGWHGYDEFGKLENWKSSFKVKEFFENCGILNQELTDDLGQILPSVLQQAIGNHIYTIRYPNKKDGKKYTWDRCTNTLAGSSQLIKIWERDVANGYPKDYDAEYVHNKSNDNGTDFPFGNNTGETGLPPDIPNDL